MFQALEKALSPFTCHRDSIPQSDVQANDLARSGADPKHRYFTAGGYASYTTYRRHRVLWVNPPFE